MKAAITILILLIVILAGYKVWDYWDKVSQQRELAEQEAKRPINPAELPGLPYQFEESLKKAESEGADGLKAWLDKNKRSPLVKDPRLAWIELEYVVLVAPKDPLEAKKVFAAVKQRTPSDSPVYRRIKELEKTYE
jgi:hypothetical protein